MGGQQSTDKMYHEVHDKHRDKKSKKWQYPTSDFEIVKLLDTEIKMPHPPVSAISFFDCQQSDLPAAEAWITDRVTQIARANRWIVGRLVHATGSGRKSLAVPRSVSKEDLDRLLLKNPKDFCPTRCMSLKQLSDEYCKIQLPQYNALAAYDKENVFVCRFVFAHTPRGFCIVFSMSHTVGDGNTFYNVMNQLSASEEVRPLDPTRKMDFSKNLKAVMDRDAAKELKGFGFGLTMMASYFGTMMKRAFARKKTRVFSGLIDGEQIEKLKADAQSRGTVPFVSTNDIITSALSNAAGAHTCLVAFNLRGRMSGLTDSLAGNYTNCMMFDKANAATPDRIRQALLHPRFHCRDEKFKMFSRCCVITNWASFSKPIRIPDCVEQMHQPIWNMTSEMATCMPFDGMVVYRAGAQRLGMCLTTPRDGSQRDVLGDIPFALDTLKCSEI